MANVKTISKNIITLSLIKAFDNTIVDSIVLQDRIPNAEYLTYTPKDARVESLTTSDKSVVIREKTAGISGDLTLVVAFITDGYKALDKMVNKAKDLENGFYINIQNKVTENNKISHVESYSACSVSEIPNIPSTDNGIENIQMEFKFTVGIFKSHKIQ